MGDFLDNEGMEVDKSVSLLITDPPYNTRNEQDIFNSTYDVLSEEKMVVVAEIEAKVLNPGGHVHLFCSAYQFRFLFNFLERIM